MDPSAWMERLRQGDREALEPLLAHYEGMLRYIVSGVLSDPHRQEDCLAEVRLKLWEKREQYDPERSSPATWLTVLCRNAAVDHLRSAQRHSAEALDETRPDPAPGPEEQLLRKERAERLERALARERTQEVPKYEEMCRRFLADQNDFSEENILKAGIWKRFQNHNLDECVKEIGNYIKSVQ